MRDRLIARAFGLILLAASSGFLVVLASACSSGRFKNSDTILGNGFLAVLLVTLLGVYSGWRLTIDRFQSIVIDHSKRQLLLRETGLLSWDDRIIDADGIAEVVMIEENRRLNDGYSEIHTTILTLVARLKDGETIELLRDEARFATPAHDALRAQFEEMRASANKALDLKPAKALAPAVPSLPRAISQDGVRQ